MKAFLCRAANVGSILAVAGLCGFAAYVPNPAEQRETRYRLVEIQPNGESDIRDYDLSADDCRARLLSLLVSRAESAFRFTCEVQR